MTIKILFFTSKKYEGYIIFVNQFCFVGGIFNHLKMNLLFYKTKIFSCETIALYVQTIELKDNSDVCLPHCRVLSGFSKH